MPDCLATYRDWSELSKNSIFRFFVEFLRTDPQGEFYGLSTPQWISMGLFIIGAGIAVSVMRPYLGLQSIFPAILSPGPVATELEKRTFFERLYEQSGGILIRPPPGI